MTPLASAERLTAIHEAAHAVMAEICGERITVVEIVGDAEHSGTVESLRFVTDPEEGLSADEASGIVKRRLKCVLAGVVAEAMVIGRQEWDDTSEDLDHAVRLAMQLVDDCEDVLPLLDDIRLELEGELQTNWKAVEMLADELMQRKTLTGAEVRKVIGMSLEG